MQIPWAGETWFCSRISIGCHLIFKKWTHSTQLCYNGFLPCIRRGQLTWALNPLGLWTVKPPLSPVHIGKCILSIFLCPENFHCFLVFNLGTVYCPCRICGWVSSFLIQGKRQEFSPFWVGVIILQIPILSKQECNPGGIRNTVRKAFCQNVCLQNGRD